MVLRSRKGVYALEWAMFTAAVVIAGMVMRPYVMSAMKAQVKNTERQLNGATQDNRP